MKQTRWSRRALMLAGGAAGFAGIYPSGLVQAKTADPRLPTDPAEQVKALVKTTGNLAGGRVTKKTRGIVMAVLADQVTPLYRFRGSESAWWRRISKDTWLRFPSTLSFFEDLETGEFIDEFASPFNGRAVNLPPSYIRHKEGEYFTPMGEYYGSMKKMFPDRYPEKPMQLNWTLDGDLLRIQGESNFPPILPQPSLEAWTGFARASRVFDPDTDSADHHTSGWNIFSGQRVPYKDMGILPGHIIWHFDSVKLGDVEEHDADYLERARRFTKVYDQSPEFDEGPSFFERITAGR